MADINEALAALANESASADTENISEQLERESRRYSRRLSEEEEARLR